MGSGTLCEDGGGNALKRLKPLSSAEQDMVFQLRSPFPHERQDALFSLKTRAQALSPFLQYVLLKEVIFAEEVPIDQSLRSLSHSIEYLVNSHFVIQQILLSALQNPYLMEKAQKVLTKSFIHEEIQWELARIATAPLPTTELVTKAFVILRDTSILYDEVEQGLARLAILYQETTDNPKTELKNRDKIMGYSYLAYQILRAENTSSRNRKALAEWVVNQKI